MGLRFYARWPPLVSDCLFWSFELLLLNSMVLPGRVFILKRTPETLDCLVVILINNHDNDDFGVDISVLKFK